MTKNLSAEVMRKYTNILWKLDDLYREGILPREVKPLLKDWNDKLGKDALKFDDRTKIDVWLKEGLVAEEQEKRRGNNYVR
tara:strand:- start:698 stop:940 length:243 start_codon:yes stop_codon:yes gene_type:complete